MKVGQTHTPEIIEHLRNTNLGRKASKATRQKMSDAKRGVKRAPRSKKWCANMSKSVKQSHINNPGYNVKKKKA